MLAAVGGLALLCGLLYQLFLFWLTTHALGFRPDNRIRTVPTPKGAGP